MADTGIILRRDLKGNLMGNPPRIGEVVYATDTNEFGWIDGSYNLVWSKFEEELPSGGTVGDVLTKTSEGFVWSPPPAPPPTSGFKMPVISEIQQATPGQSVYDLDTVELEIYFNEKPMNTELSITVHFECINYSLDINSRGIEVWELLFFFNDIGEVQISTKTTYSSYVDNRGIEILHCSIVPGSIVYNDTMLKLSLKGSSLYSTFTSYDLTRPPKSIAKLFEGSNPNNTITYDFIDPYAGEFM